jgi:hypothetical protein
MGSVSDPLAEIRPILTTVANASTKLARLVDAMYRELSTFLGGQVERDRLYAERLKDLGDAVAEIAARLPAPQAPTVVDNAVTERNKAVVDVQTSWIRAIGGAPGRLVAYLAADKVRAAGVLYVTSQVVLQLAHGSSLLMALGDAAHALAQTPAGGAP